MAALGFGIGMVDSSMMPQLGYLVDIRHGNVYGNIFFLDFCFAHPIFLSVGFWYFGHFSSVILFPFFPSCPSCLVKCKQRLYNIFVTSSPKVTKNQNTKFGMNETKVRRTVKKGNEFHHKSSYSLNKSRNTNIQFCWYTIVFPWL